MENLPSPRLRRTQLNAQNTYSLNRRIHDVKAYPVQSPQGANVLIYGHETGVTLVWRGGRRLKATRSPSQGKQNGGGSDDAVMVLDSEEEDGPAPSAYTDKPEFEDTPSDSACPEVIQTLDLALGSAAIHVAVLPMPPCTAADAAWHGADILKTKIVFAVSCATSDVYVITLPLTPPSHESKARPELRKSLLDGVAGKGAWNETLTLLAGQGRYSEAVALSIVKPKAVSERSRSFERSGPAKPSAPRVVVAASAREANGTLRFWDVSLDAKPGAPARRIEPFQTEYLPSPLTAISFNPSHATQLLAVASPHAARIYDYSIPSLPSDDTSDGPFPTQGSWLLSLYQPFAPSASAMSIARKPIVAAEWIALGRAVLTLLADGQWGIWDIDGAAPSGSQAGLFGKQNAGLRGSAITNFSASGFLEGTSPLRNPGSQKSTPMSGSGGDFVPMTPHTRALAASMGGGPERLATVRGGIEVTQLPQPRGTAAPEESAILWLGGVDPVVSVIPVISRFWDVQLRKGNGSGVNLFSGGQATRMVRLTDLGVGLLGERCTGAAAVPRFSQQRLGASTDGRLSLGDEDSGKPQEGLPIEVILQGESRLVAVHELNNGTSLVSRLVGSRSKKLRPRERQANAIIAYPRPDKPSSVAFNLSVSRRGNGAPRTRPGLTGLFDASSEALPSTRVASDGSVGASTLASLKQKGAGLAFVADLEHAADQPDDESDAENRDVEQEMMDIMEIDRELEQMAQNREQGTKHVFFEG
ncbi:hypothetical protein GQ53DRAFT_767548 [Thozetella sp. PMI_491]|nr:hypothetical protein GQ53DRAFT_767548 [Thozetella sp. PMI_491]